MIAPVWASTYADISLPSNNKMAQVAFSRANTSPAPPEANVLMDIAANGKMKVIVKKSQHLTAPDLTYQQTRNKSEQYDHRSFNGRIYSSYLITISGTLPPSPSSHLSSSHQKFVPLAKQPFDKPRFPSPIRSRI